MQLSDVYKTILAQLIVLSGSMHAPVEWLVSFTLYETLKEANILKESKSSGFFSVCVHLCNARTWELV